MRAEAPRIDLHVRGCGEVVWDPSVEGIEVQQRKLKIAALEERLKKLRAKELSVNARLRKLDSQRARKADTRRKILIGAIVLAKVEQGVVPETDLRRWLDGALRRADDRQLFGL